MQILTVIWAKIHSVLDLTKMSNALEAPSYAFIGNYFPFFQRADQGSPQNFSCTSSSTYLCIKGVKTSYNTYNITIDILAVGWGVFTQVIKRHI